MPATLERPPQPAHLKPYAFTSANATLMAQRKHDLDKLRKAQEREAAKPAQPPEPASSFIAESILRVRERLQSLYKMVEDEKEPQGIDRLCAAIAKLHEVERNLSGRPLPGSLRPKPVSNSPRSSSALVPSVPEPAPVVVPAPVQPQSDTTSQNTTSDTKPQVT